MKKILFVDDEPNVLSAIQRQLHGQFEVETALGAEAGLAALENAGAYSVVVVDMGMPGMNGVGFLGEASELAPNVVRIMLTGYLDQGTAVQAINKGSVFRFLTKPCSTEKLVETLEAAVMQHNFIVAEHELLENTLGGAIKVLTEILALAEPKSFGQAESLRDAMRAFAPSLPGAPVWELEAAAMLAQVGAITLPPELVLKARLGHPLTNKEKEVFTRIPAIGSSLIAQIPRMEGVARIILYQQKRFDGAGFPEDSISGESIPAGARMLKILADLSSVESGGASRAESLEILRARTGWYDLQLLDAVENQPKAPLPRPEAVSPTALPINFASLRVGNVLHSDLETKGGMLLVTKGNRITPMLMHRLRNFAALYGIQEPIYIEDAGTSFFARPRKTAAAL